MRRILKGAVLLGVVSLVGVGSVHAQGAGRASFHLGGGVVLPQGTFNDGFKTGWEGMGGVSFGLSGIPFALRVDGTYGQNKADGIDAKAKFFAGLVGGQYNFGGGASPVHPYILAQAGVANAKFDFPSNTAFNSSETKFAWAGGAGLGFSAGAVQVFVEGKYMQVQTSGESTKLIPIIVGVRFGGGAM